VAPVSAHDSLCLQLSLIQKTGILDHIAFYPPGATKIFHPGLRAPVTEEEIDETPLRLPLPEGAKSPTWSLKCLKQLLV
jgi:hypothetical protein